jgi:hypothetical protein
MNLFNTNFLFVFLLITGLLVRSCTSKRKGFSDARMPSKVLWMRRQ